MLSKRAEIKAAEDSRIPKRKATSANRHIPSR
jgi:hypothetical protein